MRQVYDKSYYMGLLRSELCNVVIVNLCIIPVSTSCEHGLPSFSLLTFFCVFEVVNSFFTPFLLLPPHTHMYYISSLHTHTHISSLHTHTHISSLHTHTHLLPPHTHTHVLHLLPPHTHTSPPSTHTHMYYISSLHTHILHLLPPHTHTCTTSPPSTHTHISSLHTHTHMYYIPLPLLLSLLNTQPRLFFLSPLSFSLSTISVIFLLPFHFPSNPSPYSLIRGKTQELSQEISRLSQEIDTHQKENAAYLSYEQRSMSYLTM